VCDGSGNCSDGGPEPDGTPCTDDGVFCNEGADNCTANDPNGSSCNDGDNFCTTNDTCAGGSCSGTPVSCDPNENCLPGQGCRCGSSGLNCNGSDTDYCCTNAPAGCYNISNNPDHCGYGCGNCGLHMYCDYNCLCDPGWADCTAADGCETQTCTDTNCARDCSGIDCTQSGPGGNVCVDFGGWCDCGCYLDGDCNPDFYCNKSSNICVPLP